MTSHHHQWRPSGGTPTPSYHALRAVSDAPEMNKRTSRGQGEVGTCASLRILDFMSYNLVILREFLGVEDGCNHKCRVIQKIDKTLNNSTHTAKQKRTNRHNLREVNYNRGATQHLHISHNTPCLPPPSPPCPPREIEDNACAQFWGGNRGILYNERN